MSALVLVAEADPFNLRLLSELCTTLGYEVMTAADGGAVLDVMARQRPELVLMDAALPVMDGFAVLRILKADAGLREVPVLLVTGEHDTEARERGLSLGAEDYVSKPYRTFEIQQRVRNALQLTAARRSASQPPSSALAQASFADPLTNAGTSSQLHISLDYEFTRAVRYGHPLSCVVVRVMDLPQPSIPADAASLDHIVAPLANLLKGAIRTVDHLFRCDAHEFAILLPETAHEGARIVVDRLRTLLAEAALVPLPAQPRVAVAAASYPKRRVQDGDALLRAAQQKLAH